MKEREIRLLMEVSPDNALLPGWQRGVEVQRTQTVKAGKLLYVKSFPIWDTSARRDAEAKLQQAKEKKGTTAAQKRLNARNAAERLELLINANFGAGDLLPSLTYRAGGQPKDMQEANRNVRNFIARLRNACRKQGIPDPEYVYVTETKETRRRVEYHHHMVLRIQMPRDEVEAIWKRKHGHANIKIAWDEENNLTQWAKYMAKEVCGNVRSDEYTSRHRWAASKGLKAPEPRTSDKRISRRRVEAMAKDIRQDPDMAKLHMAAIYPGYEVLEMRIKTSEWVGGAYVEAVMYNPDIPGKKEAKHDLRAPRHSQGQNRTGPAAGHAGRRAKGLPADPGRKAGQRQH